MKKSKTAFYVWLGLAIVYVLIAFLAPTTKSQLEYYHLSSLAVHWIDLSIIVPIVLILYLAYVGFINLFRYYQSIEKNPDGQAIKYLAYAVGIFAYGTLVSSIITTTVKWIAIDNVGFIADAARISNYLGLLTPLVAFWFTSEGGRRLVIVGKIKYSVLKLRIITLVAVLLGTSYSFVTFHQNSNVLSKVTAGPNIYYMPPWLVLFTIVLPYVFAWSIGLLSVMQIVSYRRRIKGVVYRAALNLLAVGLGIVLSTYVVIEYITSLSSKLVLIHIGWILVIVYCLLLMLGAGYLCVAIGSKRLKRIEEV